ncbi:MAG: T9SS type A sorting domain-containing protein [Ferruginibacter sp.]
MRNISCFILLIFMSLTGCTQTPTRIKIATIVPSENTGQDYSSWLSDDLNNLVPDCWAPANFKYIDVTVQLEVKSNITNISFYDYQGVFTDNPASVYAMDGATKTLIGTFTGDQYNTFVNLMPPTPITADALIIHKYCNNIPQKINVYGSPAGGVVSPPGGVDTTSVIVFTAPANKTVGDPPFTLVASSNNPYTPITFTSNNPSVITVAFSNNKWMATIVSTGTATITASQAGKNNFIAAADVSRQITVSPAQTVPAITGKIPIDPKRWFQLTNASNGLDALFDGATDVDVHTGWGKILDNYDSYYPVLNGEQIDLSSIRMFDGAGTGAAEPMTLSVISNTGQRIAVATFTGAQYNTWVGPDPNTPANYNLPVPFTNIRYLVINSWNFFPMEIEFYGKYTPGRNVTAAPKKYYPFKQFSGVNGFEWNFEDPNSPGQVNTQLYIAAKAFGGFRHYMDWEKLELSPGSYTYNPVWSGGWNYDALYDSCKGAGIEVLACLKTLPAWMLNTYPANQRDMENVPVMYGKNFADPKSYIEQAKVAFQYTARYGSNTNINRSLLKVNSAPRWSGDKVNTIKVGLGTVRYIECDNERDKWWKGRKAYQTAFEYAANLSAFYDGNKNTMGAGVGVKNADPNMMVVMAGTALANTDYLKGMVDWCRRFRGYKPDGSVNLCWDIINYHYYSNDSWSSQNGNATRGSAPEISGTAQTAATFIQAAHEYCNDMPVWVTEAGYDVNQGSPFKAIPIGNKTALLTQADWILRSSLLYARSGIERVFFYEMYDNSIGSSQQFNSSGLLNANKSRKPAADYLFQTKQLLGQYTYEKTINADPIVDRYLLNGNVAYAVAVPDEKGRTVQYTLNLGNAAYAKIYTPKAGSDTMDVKLVTTVNGSITILATETPSFIIPVANTGAGKIAAKPTTVAGRQPVQNNLGSPNNNSTLEESLQVYPNPVSDFFNLTVSNLRREDIALKIFEAASGVVYKDLKFDKTGSYLNKKIDIRSLPAGNYMVEIVQGNDRVVRQLIKIYR